MSKVSESLLRGAQEALEHAKGKKVKAKTHTVSVPKTVDVRAIRLKLHLTRQEFANQYGFNLRTLEKWEQGTRAPDVATRAYLTVIDLNHKAVERALN